MPAASSPVPSLSVGKRLCQFFQKYFLCFVFYSVFGWCYEVFLEVVVYRWGSPASGFSLVPTARSMGWVPCCFCSVLPADPGQTLETAAALAAAPLCRLHGLSHPSGARRLLSLRGTDRELALADLCQLPLPFSRSDRPLPLYPLRPGGPVLSLYPAAPAGPEPGRTLSPGPGADPSPLLTMPGD